MDNLFQTVTNIEHGMLRLASIVSDAQVVEQMISVLNHGEILANESRNL